MATTQSIDTVNDLLQGEISAAETYVQAEDKFVNEPEHAELVNLKAEHVDACNVLRRYVHAQGGQPATESGVWGAWAKFVEGAAKMFGRSSALKALKEGEEHGLRQYKDALQEGAIHPEIKDFIRTTLLPKTESHIATPDRLMHLENASHGSMDR